MGQQEARSLPEVAGTGRGREQLQGGERATDEGSQKSRKERSQVS